VAAVCRGPARAGPPVPASPGTAYVVLSNH
jgi:hypothetical protein